jgi:hypothetical protein
MRSLVDIPAAPIRSALAGDGWRIVAVDQPGAWWCRELWHLQSEWSPCSREAFLSFLIDPEYTLEQPKVWAVKASPGRPSEWQSGAGEHTLSFRRGWRNQIPEMIGYLDDLRKRGAVTT